MKQNCVFRRFELKYLIRREQKEHILDCLAPYMSIDRYGKSTIRNIYFDTPSYRLIRRSIEKPPYKEKLRLRSYSTLGKGDAVFVELKKKYDKIVYKRRVLVPYTDALRWLSGEDAPPESGQIGREISYFRDFYAPLMPTVFLSYEREAFYMRDGSDFRVTFDENILARTDRLLLCEGVSGESLLSDELVLMELKCTGAIPLWLVRELSRCHIYKTSFSKYGRAYENIIFKNINEREKEYV